MEPVAGPMHIARHAVISAVVNWGDARQGFAKACANLNSPIVKL